MIINNIKQNQTQLRLSIRQTKQTNKWTKDEKPNTWCKWGKPDVIQTKHKKPATMKLSLIRKITCKQKQNTEAQKPTHAWNSHTRAKLLNIDSALNLSNIQNGGRCHQLRHNKHTCIHDMHMILSSYIHANTQTNAQPYGSPIYLSFLSYSKSPLFTSDSLVWTYINKLARGFDLLTATDFQ